MLLLHNPLEFAATPSMSYTMNDACVTYVCYTGARSYGT